MKIGICEDQEGERTCLKELLLQYSQEQCCCVEVEEFSSGEELLAAFAPHTYSLLFLDVYMGDLNGLETAEAIRKLDPECLLVFVTASRDHAVEGFGVEALHYLLKPIGMEQVQEVFRRGAAVLQSAMQCITFMADRMPMRIPLRAIAYIEVYDKTCFIYTGQQCMKTYMTLEELEQQLDKSIFLRCHRSYIVNMRYIVNVEDADFVLGSAVRIPIAKAKKAAIKKQYMEFLVSAVRGSHVY